MNRLRLIALTLFVLTALAAVFVLVPSPRHTPPPDTCRAEATPEPPAQRPPVAQHPTPEKPPSNICRPKPTPDPDDERHTAPRGEPTTKATETLDLTPGAWPSRAEDEDDEALQTIQNLEPEYWRELQASPAAVDSAGRLTGDTVFGAIRVGPKGEANIMTKPDGGNQGYDITVTGKTQDAKGNPVAGAAIDVSFYDWAKGEAFDTDKMRCTGMAAVAYSDKNGVYRARFRYFFHKDGTTFLALAAKAPGHAPSLPALIEPTAPPLDLRLVLRNEVEVTCKVVDDVGKPLSGAHVYLSEKASANAPFEISGSSAGAYTDADGNVAIAGVPEGEHWLYCNLAGFRHDGPEIVHVNAQSKVLPQRVLYPGTAVRFELLDAKGKPVDYQQVHVAFYDADGKKVGDEYAWRRGDRYIGSVLHVQPGKYRVEIQYGKEIAEFAQVELLYGQTTDLGSGRLERKG